jgi:hypothetical protein
VISHIEGTHIQSALNGFWIKRVHEIAPLRYAGARARDAPTV